jgi:two-component system NarL family response regulator
MGSPNTFVVILSIHDSPLYIKAALDAGAISYVLKDLIADDLLLAVRAANLRKRYFSQRIAEIARQYI